MTFVRYFVLPRHGSKARETETEKTLSLQESVSDTVGRTDEEVLK